MRVRFSLMVLLLFACSVSAQQPPAPGVQRAAPPPGPPVPPGIGGAPPGVPAPTPAQATVIAEVKAFEKACDDAAVKGDVAFLKRALADTFIMTHGDGWITGGMPIKVDTKQTWLDYVARQPPPYVYRNLDSILVEVHGDIAITIGRYRYLPRSTNPNPPAVANPTHLFVWFERIYARRSGEWQFLSHRTTNGPNREPDEKTSEPK